MFNLRGGELVHDTRDMPYTYKGESTTLPAVKGDFCQACGEAVLEASESARVSALMLDFNKQVNASIVDPAFIANVRGKLDLDQREAAEIFGGGVPPPLGKNGYGHYVLRLLGERGQGKTSPCA